jgi:hypothetical protein
MRQLFGRKRLIVTAILGSNLIGAGTGFVSRLLSRFDGRMPFTLIGMLMPVALLAFWILGPYKFDGDMCAAT